MKSSLFAISIPVAISILAKYRGSRSVDETMFNIVVEDENLEEQAKAAHQARIQNIPNKTVEPKQTIASAKKTKMGWLLENWRKANPGIQYVSDLLFVEDLDPIGERILYQWLSMAETPEVFQTLYQTKDNVWQSKIEDANTHWNMEITRINDLSKNASTKNKKATPSLRDVAPIGKIPFYEKYGVPYRIEPKETNPSLIWK
jgi:hypothetical protein